MDAGTTTELTSKTFFDFVQANKFAVIHFWARWNGYDITLKALLGQQTPVELRKLIAFGTFDTDPAEHHEVCRQHQVRNLPYLALYRDGSLVGTVTGLRQPEFVEIIEHLRNLLSPQIHADERG